MTIVDDIKDRIDCADLIGRDVELERSGNHFEARCVFHAEKTPSLHVYPSHYHCFGCGAHGDVFTYIQQRRGLDFKEALRELARLANVVLRDEPALAKERAEQQARSDLLTRAAELYHGLLTDEARAYLHRRGFTDAFIDAAKLGFAPGETIWRLGASEAELKAAGLVNENGRDFLFNRVVFPIYGPGDQIVGLAGRALPDREPKYLAAPAGAAPLLHESGLRDPAGRLPSGERFVYLCEGDTDTATLVQAGLPVVGVRGVNGLQDEFAPKFAKIDRVYVCADADDAGLQLVARCGAVFGNKARIVALPDGEDVNSFVGQKGQDIRPLAESAPTYLDWLMARLPAEIAPEEIDRHVQAFVPALLSLGKSSQEAYAKRIARKIGVTVGPIREELRLAQNGHQNGNGKSNGHANGHTSGLDATGILWQDKPLVNPAQAIVDGLVLTTVFLDRVVTDPESGAPLTATVPHVVTSRREVFELSEAEMFRRDLHYAATKVPSLSMVSHRWSVGADRAYSVKSFVDGAAQIAPWALYCEVVGYFRRYVDYPNPLFHDFLALWTIGTYVFEFFPSYPYVHLIGTKRCGKTLTMEIIAELAFNATMAASFSGAAAYRTVEANSATLLIDEAENLEKRERKNHEGDDDKIEILKAGYKRGGKAIRCAGDNHEPTAYDAYSPKMFGSVGQIDSVLRDRVLALTLARKRDDVNLDEFQSAAVLPSLHATRDKLYCLLLEHGKEINDRIAEGIDWGGVRDRDRELWTPILVLGAFFDDARIEEQGAGTIDPNDLLTARMRRMATENVQERQARDRLDQTELLMLEAVMDFAEQATPVKDDWYASSALLTFAKTQEGLEWVKQTRQIYNELERITAISKKRDIGIQTPPSGKRTRCVRLGRARLADVARRLGLTRTVTANSSETTLENTPNTANTPNIPMARGPEKQTSLEEMGEGSGNG